MSAKIRLTERRSDTDIVLTEEIAEAVSRSVNPSQRSSDLISIISFLAEGAIAPTL